MADDLKVAIDKAKECIREYLKKVPSTTRRCASRQSNCSPASPQNTQHCSRSQTSWMGTNETPMGRLNNHRK